MGQQGIGTDQSGLPGSMMGPGVAQPQSSAPASGNTNRGFGIMGGSATGGSQGGTMGGSRFGGMMGGR